MQATAYNTRQTQRWDDGTALYEHGDPRRGEQPDWGTYVFNFGRREVRNFLVANALYWLEKALDNRDPVLHDFIIGVALGELQTDRRYVDIIRRMRSL